MSRWREHWGILMIAWCLATTATAASAGQSIAVSLPDRIPEPRMLVYLAQVRGTVADALSEAPEQVPPAIEAPVTLAALLCGLPEEMLRAAGHAGCLAIGAGGPLLDAVRRFQAQPPPALARISSGP